MRGVTVGAGDGVVRVGLDEGGVPKTPDTRAGVSGMGEMGRDDEASTGIRGRGDSDSWSSPETMVEESGEDARSSLDPAGTIEMRGMLGVISPVDDIRHSEIDDVRRGCLLGGCPSGGGPSCDSRSSSGLRGFLIKISSLASICTSR